MENEEILKVVFPFLDGIDLASCMVVCKQWKNIALDDYFWQCLCERRWPSICNQPNPPTVTYYKRYKSFYKRQNCRTLLPPRHSFGDLEFFIVIWAEDRLIFSTVVLGPVLENGMKMTIPVQSRFTVSWSQNVTFSVLVKHKDSNRVTCIINKSKFHYMDRSACKVMADEYFDLSPDSPFTTEIHAWISLCFQGNRNEAVLNVYGIEMNLSVHKTSRKRFCSY